MWLVKFVPVFVLYSKYVKCAKNSCVTGKIDDRSYNERRNPIVIENSEDEIENLYTKSKKSSQKNDQKEEKVENISIDESRQTSQVLKKEAKPYKINLSNYEDVSKTHMSNLPPILNSNKNIELQLSQRPKKAYVSCSFNNHRFLQDLAGCRNLKKLKIPNFEDFMNKNVQQCFSFLDNFALKRQKIIDFSIKIVKYSTNLFRG